MSNRFDRLLNASVLLGAITLGVKAVELHNLWMCSAALFCAYSYTLFTEDKKRQHLKHLWLLRLL